MNSFERRSKGLIVEIWKKSKTNIRHEGVIKRWHFKISNENEFDHNRPAAMVSFPVRKASV